MITLPKQLSAVWNVTLAEINSSTKVRKLPLVNNWFTSLYIRIQSDVSTIPSPHAGHTCVDIRSGRKFSRLVGGHIIARFHLSWSINFFYTCKLIVIILRTDSYLDSRPQIQSTTGLVVGAHFNGFTQRTYRRYTGVQRFVHTVM
jgi:hypothetical protein